ncbi:hypothetical protein BD779DRAFT_1533508 [Infundibulicybe gibba]|nr:hypothetical protein BD779DRAFT_1533508 [Infundibulicybe gibba]
MLPGDRILSFSRSDMFIYQIPPLEVVPASSSPDWTVRGMSPVRTDGDTTSFTIFTAGGVRAVTIPATPGQPPILTKLNFDPYDRRSSIHSYFRRQFCLGWHNSIIHGYPSMTVLTHPEPDGIITSRLCPIPGGHRVFDHMRPCLDEASGRLALATYVDSRNMFLVLDFTSADQT